MSWKDPNPLYYVAVDMMAGASKALRSPVSLPSEHSVLMHEWAKRMGPLRVSIEFHSLPPAVRVHLPSVGSVELIQALHSGHVTSFAIADRVKICGAHQLTGKFGVVQSFTVETGRYRVQLDAAQDHRSVGVQPENLACANSNWHFARPLHRPHERWDATVDTKECFSKMTQRSIESLIDGRGNLALKVSTPAYMIISTAAMHHHECGHCCKGRQRWHCVSSTKPTTVCFHWPRWKPLPWAW